MALIACPECNKRVSERAPRCPHCGNPIATAKAEPKPKPNDGSEIPYAILAKEQAPAKSKGGFVDVIGGCLGRIIVGIMVFAVIPGCIKGCSNAIEKRNQQRMIDDALKDIRQGK